MSCGFNVACHAWSVIEPFWFWLQVGFWVAVAAFALWALSKVKDIAGWPGVATVAGIGLYLLGHMRGRSGKSVIPDFDGGNVTGSEATPPVRRPKPKVVLKTAKRSGGKRRYNYDTNIWE